MLITARIQKNKMIVTSIKKLDKRKSLLYIDYEQAFSLYNTEIRRFHITENEDMEDHVYNEILTEILPKRCFERSLYILKESNKTKYQIREKLKSNYYPLDIIESVIQKLEKLHYVDDFQYCYDYYLYNIDQKSKKKIYFDLMRKGITKSTFQDVVEALEENEEDIEQTQYNLLINKLEKLCKNKNYRDPKIYQKISASLMRNGFKYVDITRAFHSLKDVEK